MIQHFKENAGHYSVGAIVLIVILALIQLNVFEMKADLYRDFVTKVDYRQDQDLIQQKLDYIINRLDKMAQ